MTAAAVRRREFTKPVKLEIVRRSMNARGEICCEGCGLAEGFVPYKAEVLCDKATDREKKARAYMENAEGQRRIFERTLGGRNFTISSKPAP